MNEHEATAGTEHGREETNRAEWENPDNWSHPVFGLYFSKRDTRVWVPKRTPGWGWTLNLGRPAAVWWIVGLTVLPTVLARLGRRRGRRRRD